MRNNPIQLVEKIDGNNTTKYLWKVRNKYLIESCYFWLPTKTTDAMCVSSAIGCPYSCIFCASGKGPFEGNLTFDEIIAQVNNMLVEKNTDLSNGLHIAFYGIGEPLFNFENIVRAINEIQNAPEKYSKNPEIWVGTHGLTKEIGRLANLKFKFPVGLQISLHSPWDKNRKSLLPAKRGVIQESLSEILKVGEYYSRKNECKKVALNYLLIQGINDSLKDLQKLKKIVNPEYFMVKLSKLNLTSSNLKFPKIATFNKFKSELENSGIKTMIYSSPGGEITAGCGQLRYKQMNA